MNGFRIILTGLYLLLMVLVPSLHQAGHASSSEPACHSSCSGHTPQEQEPPPDDADSCSLCQLLLLQIDSPSSEILITDTILAGEMTAEPQAEVTSLTLPRPQARAPPNTAV